MLNAYVVVYAIVRTNADNYFLLIGLFSSYFNLVSNYLGNYVAQRLMGELEIYCPFDRHLD